MLAAVNRGTSLAIVGRQGQWRQVVLSGWIWAPSVASTGREGYDLVVSADGGENLRERPGADAAIEAHLLEGFLLEKTGGQGSWVHVRRTAWMWAPSLATTDGGGGGTGEGSSGAAPAGRPSGPDSLPGLLVVKGAPARLFVSPQGDTLGVVRPGADLRVLDRQGGWSRVRLEGWVRNADLMAADSAAASTSLTPADLKANPGQYVGREVRWNVQFISLEKAESVRTDFYEGEPFILARTPSPPESFVYLAVPSDLVSRVKALRPLQTIQVVGRVRTGRSALMGAPVLDLLEIR